MPSILQYFTKENLGMEKSAEKRGDPGHQETPKLGLDGEEEGRRGFRA